VGEPEGNGVAEWLIRTLKEQVIWPSRFKNVAAAAEAINAFVQEFKKSWIINGWVTGGRLQYCKNYPTTGR